MLTPAELRNVYKSFLTINRRAGDVLSVLAERLLFLMLPRDVPDKELLFTSTSSLLVGAVSNGALLAESVMKASDRLLLSE